MRVSPFLIKRLIASALPVLVATALAGCPEGPPGGGGGGINLPDGGFTFPSEGEGEGEGENPIDPALINTVVVVERINPPSGPIQGLNRVEIDGQSFAGIDQVTGISQNRVFFGCTAGVASDDPGGCEGGVEGDLVLGLQLPTKISVRVPPCTSPGPKTVRVVNPLGVGELAGGYTCFSPVTLDGIVPNVGSTDGGEPVTITGVGFTRPTVSPPSAGMIVTIGGRQVVGLVVDSETQAHFLTPPGTPGRADVLAIDAFGRSVFELAFTYVPPLRLDTVTPNVVDDDNAVVELGGAGFIDDVRANISGVDADRNNLISESRFRVTVPGPGAPGAGAHDVRVDRGPLSSTLAGALVVRPAVTGAIALTAAVPRRADTNGGDVITLVGEQLTGATALTVGASAVAAGAFTVVDDRTITFTAPAAALPGAVDVTVTAPAGNATLAGALVYFDRVVVDDTAPSFGPSGGGTPIEIFGRGFDDGSGGGAGIAVTFGGIPATDIVVVDDGHVNALTPPGAAGPVDVAVVVGTGAAAERGVLRDAYRYDALLSVIGVRPSRGGMGGETFVTITGTGFTKGIPSVFFGDPGVVTNQALPLDVVVENDSTLTCRTPFHDAGLVDVSVTLNGGVPGAETATASQVFTYFNPTNVVGGAGGGEIDGAVYITALDAILGLPIPGLVGYVGTSSTPIASGITNVLGQATISSPDIVGPQTVTVMGDCFQSTTFVDVNSTNLTAYLFPTCGGPPTPGGTPPPQPPPATIAGRVFGFAKEFFDPAALDQSGCATGAPAKCELAAALVETTSSDEFSGDNGVDQNGVFEEGGSYFIPNSRTGLLAVVALAGILDINNNTFRLRQMGVRNEVFPQRGVDLVDQDIELTIPLDNTIDMSLPDAPLRAVNDDLNVGFLPTITRVMPFLQFGGEGSLFYTQALEGKRNHALDTMPEVPGELLTFISGAYTTDGRNLLADTGTISMTEDSPFVTGNGTFDWGATDPFGDFVIVGAALVTQRPSTDPPQFFASVVLATDGVSQIQLQNAPDFDLTGAVYHIGNPGAPSSEVIQDGVGDMRGGVTIQPVLGLPQVLSPLENGVLTDRTLRWKQAAGQQPTIHDMFIFEPFAFSTIWEFYVDGSRTKVIVPQIPELDGILNSLPTVQRACVGDPTVSDFCAFYGLDPTGEKPYVPPSDMARGGMAWQHEAIFTPGLDYNNWSLIETGTRGRRAWTTDVHVFVHGDDGAAD